ncbi:MAG: GNAT family N-acetyltransferase [Thaumarchaeota archaeon]|nr:GNAT family N-acetyltransferase [Nitrososphaerota archaeon]
MSVRIRDAEPSDKNRLMSFIKDIWGGHDYIPYVWDEWLDDKSGRMFVVDIDGVPVGMNRVRFMEDGSAWFEGARIHPDFRGRGFASMLGENSMGVARGRGVKVFRLTSSSWNRTAHRQIARIRFKEASRVSVYEPGKGKRFLPKKGVRKAEKRDLRRVVETIRGSKEFRLGSGVFWDSFAAIALSPPVLRELVARGEVWVSDGAVVVTRRAREGREVWRQVCFLAGDKEGAGQLLSHVLSLRGDAKLTRKLVYLPQGSSLICMVRALGLKRMASLILFVRGANG